MTPDKQASTSEWVELGVELADEAARWAYKAGDHGDRALLERRDAELASLRSHLEAKDREHLAARALVKQLAALLERYVACDVSMDNMNRNDVPRDLKSSNLHRESVAALAAYQEKT